MNRTLRRIFLLIVCTLLLVTIFTACNNRIDHNQKNLINVRIENSTIEIYKGSFNERNVQVYLDYDDGTTETVTLTQADLPEQYHGLLNNVGSFPVELLYDGFKLKFTIVVKDPMKTVTFLNYNDDVVKTVTVDMSKNETIVPPTNEEMYVEGYRFTGEFDGDYVNATEDITVKGIYVKTYKVSFYNFYDELVKMEEVDEGASATAPAFEEMSVEGYRFTGEYDNDFTNVTSDISVKGIYVKTFLVEFFNGNSELISSQYVDIGADAVEPPMEDRAVPGYEWYAWDNEFTNIQEDTRVYGIYLKTYTLTYSSNDENLGTVSGSVESGSQVQIGTNVTLTAEAKSGCTFEGWYRNNELVSTDAEYTFLAYPEDYNFLAKFTGNTGNYSEGLEFTSYGDGTCYVSGIGTCTDTDVKIPPVSPDGESVVAIGYRAFADCNSFTSIEITHGVTSIDVSAFYNCTSIKSVTIPDSVTNIGDNTFEECTSLTSVIFEENSQLTSIGDCAFYNCTSITSIRIPDNVESIGMWTFSGCTSLTSVTFATSSNLTTIEEGAFFLCYSLTGIEIPHGVTSIGDRVFYWCYNLTSVTFAKHSQLSNIGYSAFEDCNSLTSITIPDSVTDIGDYAFRGCESLANMKIPSNMTSINNALFLDCTSLTTVIIHDGVTSIGDRAFAKCRSLSDIKLPDNLLSIGSDAFHLCTALKNVIIPSSVTSIGVTAFRTCISLENITVDGNNAYYKSIDGNLYTKDEKTLIQYAIGKSSTQFTIPNNVINLADYSFSTSKLSKVIFEPESKCENIGNSAFVGCQSLTSITIPDSVTKIGDNAFEYCDSLISIKISDNVTTIGNYAFLDCRSLTSITIPDSVTDIGDYALCGCESLASITVDEKNQNYQSIDGNLYTKDGKILIQYATGKTDEHFIIPSCLTSIGKLAFSYCSSLKSITFAEESQLNSIDRSAFYFSSLISIEIPSSVTSIGYDVFLYCHHLENISFAGTVEQWNAIEFEGNWYYGDLVTHVQCSNGTVPLN